MQYLLLAIMCGTINHLMMKAFQRRQIDVLSAISVNYLICVIIGFASSIEKITTISLSGQTWFYYSIFQGILFIGTFFLMFVATQKNGIAIAALSTRLAVVIPTIAAFFLYGDSFHMLKIMGITFALFALFLSSFEKNLFGKNTAPGQKWVRFFPLCLFLVAGAHMSLAKYVQEFHLDGDVYHTYLMASTAFAFLTSAVVLGYKMIFQNMRPGLKDGVAGIILGINNYGALYFLIRTIGQKGWESSVVFPTLSVAVVMLSFAGGYAIFKESVTQRKMLALGMGIVGIVLINV